MSQHQATATSSSIIISDAIARSVVKATNCNLCKESLIIEDIPDHVEIQDPTQREAAGFFNGTNRGGLLKRNNFKFIVAMHCWRVFER